MSPAGIEKELRAGFVYELDLLSTGPTSCPPRSILFALRATTEWHLGAAVQLATPLFHRR